MIEPLEWCPRCESSKHWLYEQQCCLACGYEPELADGSIKPFERDDCIPLNVPFTGD